MSGFTLDHLQELLAEEEAKEPEFPLKKPSIEAIHQVYQNHGIEAPLKGLWTRPIPADLYKCPLSQAPTTLVQWESLPHATQQRLGGKAPADGIVEIPRSYLQPEEDILPSNATPDPVALQNRPLNANLSNKLTEYTRGVSGQCRPFRAGGVSAEEVKQEVEDPYTTPEAIERAKSVLEKGSQAAWQDQTLITAPPGVDFKIGLSYQDVYGRDDNAILMEQVSPSSSEPLVAPEEIVPETAPILAQPVGRSAQGVMWDRSFFDDDSLFGSSTSGSSSEDESDQEDDQDDQKETDANDKVVEASEDEPEDTVTEDEDATELETTELSIDDNDIDGLLAALSRAEASTNKQMVIDKENPDTDNPLQLAEKQAQLQSNTTCKSWANTALLPIDDFNSWIPNPAMTFPFTLDSFQQQAVARLERNESVFIAAHTSAGKTVVAEYACALAKQRGTRCIYTSPIKALSNQKFRDFCTKFGKENVGLITGDMQLNVDDSTCLIMTTEILRSMLYRGADLIRDIEWVIFDEVHYVNDTERGVVWEEVIIMLPSYVNLIFLSATTPNTLDFSDWIGRTKRKSVHVIKTDYRPVPLSHHLWAGLKLNKIMEGKSGFLDKGYKEATNALLPKSAADKKAADKKGGAAKGKTVTPAPRGGPKHLAWQAQGNKNNWMSLVRFLEREELTPTVIFSFSKKKCEEIADMLQSLDLNTGKEGSAVQGFTLQTIARLSPIDATLPQVVSVCEMVKRGIGVHHGGLLPILKEMVEILFSRNLIKVLFATETFAMGVNMPARAVVFNSIRKHDGTQFRVLEPGEYTQMAGRAGRRGLDKVGTVIMCCFGETPPPMPILRNMLTGQSTMLRSQFRLTYNMILNLLRVEEMSVENMIKRSFSEFATQRALTANEYPKLLARGQKTLAKLEEQFQSKSGQRVGADDLEEYFSTCSELLAVNRNLLSFILESGDDGALQPGKIILVSAARKYGVVHAPALVLKAPSLPSATAGQAKPDDKFVCMLLLPESYIPEAESDKESQAKSKPGTIGYVGLTKQRYYAIYEVKLEYVLLVSGSKQKIDANLLLKETSSTSSKFGSHAQPNADFFGGKKSTAALDNPFAGMKVRGKKGVEDLGFGKKKNTGVSSEAEALAKAVETLIEAEQEELGGNGLHAMDLRDSVKRGSDVIEFRSHCGVMENLVLIMRQFSSHRHPNIEKYFTILERKRTLKERVDALNHLLSNESLQLFPDFLQRKAVLRTLGYIDEHETVCVKGRVACEVNTCEELIVTEMVFEGILNDLEPTEIVAALSALVYQQKSDDDELDMEVPESLIECSQRMKKIATNLGQLMKEHGLEVDPNEYCDNTLKFGLLHVVYEWALGVPFSSICDLTTVQEGSIVRCITRLDELCREVRNCARVVGNPTLYRKMEAASVAIKRDIVFASSLYVS